MHLPDCFAKVVNNDRPQNEEILGTLASARGFDFKGCLECTHCADLKAWRKRIFPKTLRQNVCE